VKPGPTSAQKTLFSTCEGESKIGALEKAILRLENVKRNGLIWA